MRTSTTSPLDMGPTPSGVPVAITSPGRNVMNRVMNSNTWPSENSSLLVLEDWTVVPLSSVSILSEE